jgi:prevent-host-death family protein
MSQVTIEEAATRLSELIDGTPAGEEIILTRNDQPVAKLIPLSDRPRPRRGSGKGFILRIADDFDEIPEGFEEYMP